MQEASCRRHLDGASGGGVIGGGIWYLEGIWRHLEASGGIWETSEGMEAFGRQLRGIWKHLGCIWEASTLGFPPSLNNESHKLNIQYYQYVVHGIFKTSPKCLQRVWNNCDKIVENLAQGLHFNMLLGLGSCPGTPWGPSWDGDPKNHKKNTFWDPPFEAYLWQMLALLWSRFLHVS